MSVQSVEYRAFARRSPFVAGGAQFLQGSPDAMEGGDSDFDVDEFVLRSLSHTFAVARAIDAQSEEFHDLPQRARYTLG